jgi:tetratricopeptide (TPR) repeat protein
LKKTLTYFIFSLFTTVLVGQVKPPKFPGGDKGFYKFCGQNFNFSDEILLSHFADEIPISIFISKTGKVDSVEFWAESKPLIMEQLKEMFKEIPDFKPAQRGKYDVASQLNLIIKISLPTAKNNESEKFKFEKSENVATMINFGNVEFLTYKGLEKAEDLYLKGQSAIKEGDLFLAHDYLSESIEFNPNHMEALHELGAVAFKIGLNQEACDCWKKGYEMGDSDLSDLLKRNCD